MFNSILISKNIQLTFKLIAKAIYVSPSGEITIVAKQYGPHTKLPQLTVEYLESLCSKFYYGGYSHPHAIADIMLLNGYLQTRYYGDFYANLRSNLEEQRVTIISSELSL
jgi:hypothetical protein